MSSRRISDDGVRLDGRATSLHLVWTMRNTTPSRTTAPLSRRSPACHSRGALAMMEDTARLQTQMSDSVVRSSCPFSCVHDAAAFDEHKLYLLLAHRTVPHAAREGVGFGAANLDRTIEEVDPQRGLEDEERLVRVRVVVPHELALHACGLELVVVEFGDDPRLPVLKEEVDLLLQIDHPHQSRALQFTLPSFVADSLLAGSVIIVPHHPAPRLACAAGRFSPVHL